MSETAAKPGPDGMLRLKISWALMIAWLVLFAVTLALPNAIPGLFSLALPIIMLLHGSMLYGWKGMAAYMVIGIIVGFALEASSVANGFPFGSYTHNVAGPKPAGVPLMAIFGYTLIGWFAWTLGKTIVLERPDRPGRWGRVTVPLAAAFILAGFDLPYDPIGATVKGDWTFTYPSGQFGVPLTNFLGWILTGWVLFQIFALVEHRFTPTQAAGRRSFWLLPCLFWLGTAAQFPFMWMRAPAGTVSLGERSFVIADVYEASIVTSLFTMIGIVVFAVSRLADFDRK